MEEPTAGNDEVDVDMPKLPPGFRFHPTDEEIVVCYLMEKVFDAAFTAIAIGEADLNKCEPWDLPKKAGMGEKERYFFCQRDRKYPTGVRTNRATKSGYWKATGKDREIFQGKNRLVGMKKTLVFYKGRAPKGEKMNWVMHEYRLAEGKSSSKFSNSEKDEWVVCKIFNKNTGTKKDCVQIQTSRNVDSYQDAPMQPLPLGYSSEGFYLDSFPPVKPEKASPSMNDDFIRSNASNTSTNHYYSFDFGLHENQLSMAMFSHSEETTDVSGFISHESHLDADLWDYDY